MSKGNGSRRASDPSAVADPLDALVEYALTGQAEAAEEYLLDLMSRNAPLEPAYFDTAMSAYLVTHRPEDVERLFQVAQRFLPGGADEDIWVTRVRGWGFGGWANRAWQWWAGAEAAGETPPAAVLAELIIAMGAEGFGERLRTVRERAQAQYPDDGKIAESFVYAFGMAKEPDDAEECLHWALGLVDDGERRSQMARDCVFTYIKAGRRPEGERFFESLVKAGIDLDPIADRTIYETDGAGPA